jgi:hypothetical protein
VRISGKKNQFMVKTKEPKIFITLAELVFSLEHFCKLFSVDHDGEFTRLTAVLLKTY